MSANVKTKAGGSGRPTASERSNPGPKIVICGAGIIGVSIAYHLAKRGTGSILVERCGVACAASGKAGGFLARDWCDTYELGPLAQASFDMHAELAKTLPNCDYRRLDTFGIGVKEGGRRREGALANLPDWLDGPLVGKNKMGSPNTTAQVHPYKLTNAMLEAAMQMTEVTVRIATVTGIQVDEKDSVKKVTGVKVGDDVIQADVVVIAMGPWTGQASRWINVPPIIRGSRVHSIIMKPKQPVSAHALFVDFHHISGASSEPEVYPRPDGDVYMCGLADDHPLPEDPNQIKPNPDKAEKIKQMAGTFSTTLHEAEVSRTQACYLPGSVDGLPIIGKIPDVAGLYMASGHSCWGILNAPITGQVVAELILEGKASTVDISDFSPARFY